SAGAEALYGWSGAEALGRRAHDLLATEFPRPLGEVEAEVAARGFWEGELVHARRDGSRVEVASRWALRRDGEGRPRAILELNTDISERKALERLERRFLSMVAHDLRGPLTALGGYAQLLQRRRSYSDRAVAGIRKQVARLDRLIGDLRDVWELRGGRF